MMRLNPYVVVAIVAILLAACGTNTRPENNAEQRAKLIQQLPADADLTRLDEQAQWIKKGFYITKTGQFAPLPKNDNGYQQLKLQGRPDIKQQKATQVENQPIYLPLPDNNKTP